MVGYVDYGKMIFIKVLIGIWMDMYSEELRRGIIIKIGFVDVEIRKCLYCGKYLIFLVCFYCGYEIEFERRVLFIDVLGYEVLMMIMLVGVFFMDGVVFVIVVNEGVMF